MSDDGRRRQREIYIAGLGGDRPSISCDLTALEDAARNRLPQAGFDYLAGGAGTESTIRENRQAFERWRITPRVLRDVVTRNTAVELFGLRLPSPFLLAPIGVLDLAHRDADLAVARAAASEDVPMIFSNQASVPMEECARMMGDGPRWFQLYWSTSDAVVESFVRRAERCGCGAIVLTLDTTLLGWRPRDLDAGHLPFLSGRGIAQYVTDPVFREELKRVTSASDIKPRLSVSTVRAALAQLRNFPGTRSEKRAFARLAVQHFVNTYSRPSLTWSNVRHLRTLTELPILLKGILHPEDAVQAIECGVDGVIVSNHGGRQVDGAIASLDALPDVVRAVDDRIAVLFDSGIRGGADIFKALALGARAVLLGRPYAFGLALEGEAGVRQVIRNLKADFDLTLGLAGCTTTADLTRDYLTSHEVK